MKKLRTVVTMSLAILMAFLTTPVFASGQVTKITPKYITSDSLVNYTVYAYIPYGNSKNSVTTNDRIPETQDFGPESFVVLSDGSIYILDSLSESIKHFAKNGSLVETIQLPIGIYALDIANNSKTICMMDSDGYTYTYPLDGSSGWKKIGQLSRSNVAGLYTQNDIIYSRSFVGADTQITNTKASALMAAASDPAIVKKNSDGISVTIAGTAYQVNYSASPAGTYIMKSNGNNTYIMEREVLLNTTPYAEIRVGQFINGSLSSTALPKAMSEYKYSIPFKKLYIADSGSVYQMIPEKDGVTIYIVPWLQGEHTRITPTMISLDKTTTTTSSSSNNDSAAKEAALSKTVSISTALDRAYNICFTGWWYDASEMHTPTGTYTKSPVQLGSTDKQVAGVPYCWGGCMSWDSATYSGSTKAYFRNYLTALSDGCTAGNIKTNSSSWVSGTAGIDCSGFITVCYKFTSKLSCKSIPNYFTQITWAESAPGDVALRYGHHTYMIKHKYTDSSGQFYMMSSYESTNGGSSYHGTTICYHDLVDVTGIFYPYRIN